MGAFCAHPAKVKSFMIHTMHTLHIAYVTASNSLLMNELEKREMEHTVHDSVLVCVYVYVLNEETGS